MTASLFDLFDGKAAELDICNPSWLYAGRLTDLAGGNTWRFVYRSTVIRPEPDNGLYAQILDFLDGAIQIGETEVVFNDPDMFGSGELTIWE